MRAPTLTKLGPSGVDDGVCVRVPKTNPRFDGSVGGLAGLSIVVLMAVIYYNKARSAKGRRRME